VHAQESRLHFNDASPLKVRIQLSEQGLLFWVAQRWRSIQRGRVREGVRYGVHGIWGVDHVNLNLACRIAVTHLAEKNDVWILTK